MRIKIYSLIFLFFLFFQCGKKDEKVKEEVSEHEEHHDENIVELTSEQFSLSKIKLGSIEKKNLSSIVKVNGVLDVPPQNLVSISAPLGGFVKETELLQGMRIKKGQRIAVIENPEFIELQQEYLETFSKLEYLEAEFKRQKELSEENISSSKIFQQTTSELKTYKARLAGIEAKLALAGINPNNISAGKILRTAYITSPINGFVTEINVNIGKYVTPTDVMFEIADTEHLHVELTVFEKDVPKIKEGQKVIYTLADDPAKQRTASVYLIGRAISEDRTVRIHAHMDEEDIHILPGMYVRAVIETGNNAVDALPEEALVQSEGKDYIFVLKSQNKEEAQFEIKEVATGVKENGFVEVTLPQALRGENVKIVIEGAYTLLSKMKNSEEEGGHAH